MKFISWNVNGLRAVIRKGFLDDFKEFDADIVALQEIKLSEGQIDLETPGYEQYFNYAQRKGYSGTAIFAKHKPLNVKYGIGMEEFDIEGRVITLEYENFYFVNCYTPNSKRGLLRLKDRIKWDERFREYLDKLKEDKGVIVCGDLNVAHEEIDIKNPSSNHKSAGFTDEEREDFTKLLNSGYIDTYRYFYPNKIDAYTWWSNFYNARERNIGWRIDYFLVSEQLKRKLEKAIIYSNVMGSDHCPIGLILK